MSKVCPLGPKHVWAHVEDVTLTTKPTPNTTKFSRRGIYKCGCGALKYGRAKSGL